MYPVNDNVDDNGSAYQRGDGSQGNNAILAWQETDEVAQQRSNRSAENGGRHQHQVVIGAKQQASHMGYG